MAITVNDVHSRLNETVMSRVVTPRSFGALRRVIFDAKSTGETLSFCGGRHAMGGQQFAADSVLIDLRRLSRVIHFDRDSGLIEVEAGIEWPALVRYLIEIQVAACHPQFAEFLRKKRAFDPNERFQSDWYRHYRSLFATKEGG